MKQYIKKKGFGLIAASVVLAMGAVSCSEDIDESNLYSLPDKPLRIIWRVQTPCRHLMLY